MHIPKPKDRDLYLAQQVDQASINLLTKEIININESDIEISKISKIYNFTYTPKPIKIYIDSYGGSVYQCFGLLSIIKDSKTPIHTIVTGCAMSCGFLISITGHKRLCYEKSTFLYHQVSGGTIGTLKEMEDEIIETKRLMKMLEEHTLEHTKMDKDLLEEIYEKKKDYYINPIKALKLGIIDEIIK